jgi:hypothetical protein
MNHPGRAPSEILDLARRRFRSRGTISREEMRDFLSLLAARGADLSADGYAPGGNDLPTAWAALCDDITTVSLTDGDPGAPASINQGTIRYDQPGQMYPGFFVTLMFAPSTLRDLPYDQIGQLRRRCRRLLVVRQ